MKICITTNSPNLDSLVDPRFGRCQYFLIVDEKSELIKAIPNEAGQAMRGAGIAAAQLVIDSGVQAVITGNVGPNAYYALNSSGIKIFPVVFGVTAKDALKMYKDGKLKEVTLSPDAGPGRFGPPGSFRQRGFGPGRGLGRGRR